MSYNNNEAVISTFKNCAAICDHSAAVDLYMEEYLRLNPSGISTVNDL